MCCAAGCPGLSIPAEYGVAPAFGQRAMLLSQHARNAARCRLNTPLLFPALTAFRF